MSSPFFPLHDPDVLDTPPSGRTAPLSRRILISNLPASTHLYSILKRIHSGVILSATLLDTTPHLGAKSALIEFLHAEDATSFLKSLNDRVIYLPSPDGTVVAVPVARLPSPSAPVPPRISTPIQYGASRVVLAVNFPRRCIFPLLVEADLHRGMGIQSVVEVSYSEQEGGMVGMGRLSVELASVSAAHRLKVTLLRRCGLLSGLPAVTDHFFGRDPCAEAAADCVPETTNLPLNVEDPVRFFSLSEFLGIPLTPTLPDPYGPVVSTGLVTRTPREADLSPATCSEGYAVQEFSVKPWTHLDLETGACRVRVPFGWSMSVEDALRDYVYHRLETGKPEADGVIDDYFNARGLVNLRKLISMKKGRINCPANLWGMLQEEDRKGVDKGS